MKKKIPYSYCIFYVEEKHKDTINKELKEKGYQNIKAIIPYIKILKKTIKGKMVYEDVPLLFNYGFIKMPTELAYSRYYLNKLKRQISGIRGWLKSTETLHPRKKKVRIDNVEDFDDFSIVATCTKEDVRRFRRLARENKSFSVDDLLNLKIGDYVVLKGYPFEGIDATVLNIDYVNKIVECLLYPQNGKMVIKLPFDNVLYSVYQNFDANKLYANSYDYDPNQITDEAINNIMVVKKN